MIYEAELFSEEWKGENIISNSCFDGVALADGIEGCNGCDKFSVEERECSVTDNVVLKEFAFVFDEGEGLSFVAGGGAIIVNDGSKHFVWGRKGCHENGWNRVGLDRPRGMVPGSVCEGWEYFAGGG